ncbi:MAG: 5'-methylthioadenosine/S-adenosylhomocysteine nucleosidase [Defluviitaleaceae bacterium]|nr:5'-methylthioadenosine/S-adenosylhomocysteine nucleosidase [Defluviitaleaceae bacterium]
MIGIIGAMQQEVEILKAMMNIQHVEKVMHVAFTVGTLHDKEVVLLESGIGKVNVAVATTLLMEKFKPTCVINTGSAGGIQETAEVGDVVLSETVAYHDVDVTGFGYAFGQVPGLPAVFEADPQLILKVEDVLKKAGVRYFKGQIVTGDAFVHHLEPLNKIKENFIQAVALEMEAAAVAQVCHLADVPFVVVRALSDIAGKASHLSFEEFLPTAAEASSQMVAALVNML